MKALALDTVNGEAPYKVSWHETSHTYRFKTDYDVVLAIAFDEDDMIETADSYVLSVINVNSMLNRLHKKPNAMRHDYCAQNIWL